MTLKLATPTVDDLDEVVTALREWQDDSPMQLHPGDLGWNWQFGTPELAAALRTWRRDGTLVAVGLLDSPGVLRLTTSPGARRDRAVADDLLRDVLAQSSVETPNDTLLQDLLGEQGWTWDAPWTPLRLDLTGPVDRPDLRVEVVGPDQAATYAEVHQSAFGSPRFTSELWHTMAGGIPYRDGRSLLGFDNEGNAVAEVTVWSAGTGRPGLLEPMGVHADHRGHGHGRATCLAAAKTLRELGSSSAVVCTPSVNTGGIATYVSAGYRPEPERRDRTRVS